MADTPPGVITKPTQNQVTLDRHPLLRAAAELSWDVDRLPACADQTALIIGLSEWRTKLVEHLVKHGLLKE